MEGVGDIEIYVGIWRGRWRYGDGERLREQEIYGGREREIDGSREREMEVCRMREMTEEEIYGGRERERD